MTAIKTFEKLLYLHRKKVYLFLLCSIALGNSAMAQPQVTLTTNGIQGIELSESENIPDKLLTILRASDAAVLLPYTVVVYNKGSLPITGLDVRYEIVTHGDMVVKNFFYGSPVDIADFASFPVIAPGQGVAIGPSHAVNEQLMSRGMLSLSAKHISSITRTVEFMSGADRIKIAIDSVIHTGGILSGPDRSGTLRRFHQEIAGYKEFRDELLKRFSKGESDADIVSWLLEARDAKVVRSGRNQPLDRGVIMKKLVAQEYLSYMSQGRREYAWNTLKAATPEVKLRRIIKVRKEVQP